MCFTQVWFLSASYYCWKDRLSCNGWGWSNWQVTMAKKKKSTSITRGKEWIKWEHHRQVPKAASCQGNHQHGVYACWLPPPFLLPPPPPLQCVLAVYLITSSIFITVVRKTPLHTGNLVVPSCWLPLTQMHIKGKSLKKSYLQMTHSGQIVIKNNL